MRRIMGVLAFVVAMIFAGIAFYEGYRKGLNKRVVFHSLYAAAMMIFSIAYFCGYPMEDIRAFMVIFTITVACIDIKIRIE